MEPQDSDRVRHATIVVERRYAAPPSRVFKAWADPVAYGGWNAPGEGWEVAEQAHEFRVGGRNSSLFGPKGQAIYRSEGRFEDIIADRRIVTAGTMHWGEQRTSTTLCTVELLPDGGGTRLILTDQTAFYAGSETAAQREGGWNALLDNLSRALS